MKMTKVNLQTSKLLKLKKFYVKTLDLTLVKEDDESFSVQAGKTILTFTNAKEGEPFYHFAFNIPENKIEEAQFWLSDRVKIIPYQNKDIVDFKNWNAHSIYFEDPAGNIVELIARHNLHNGTTTPFSSKAILNVSEIGLPVDNVLKSAAYLSANLPAPIWKEYHETFTTLGDENGLFIVVNKGRQWFMSEHRSAYFPIKITLDYERFEGKSHEGYLFQGS